LLTPFSAETFLDDDEDERSNEDEDDDDDEEVEEEDEDELVIKSWTLSRLTDLVGLEELTVA